MSDTKDQHEPSMEEILASIRRIISEDGDSTATPTRAAAPAASPAAAAPTAAAPEASPDTSDSKAAPKPERELIADIQSEEDDDVLLLTEEVDDESPSRIDEESTAALESEEPPVEAEAEAAPDTPAQEPEPEAAGVPQSVARLISERTAAASLAAMSELLTRSQREPNIESLPMGQSNRTLEEITRDLLRPILKSWLDENLPQIVERVVREEIGRLALDAQRR